MSDGLYSTNYINIFSTSPPTVISHDTSEYECREQCNINSKCSGYTFIPTYSITCLGTTSPIDISTCKSTIGVQPGASIVHGSCYGLVGSDEKSIPNPLYIKNQCSNFKDVCTTIWSTHFNVFTAIISIFLVLNIYLMYLCLQINSMFYRNLNRKMIIFTMLMLVVLGGIISAFVIKYG